MKRNSLPFVLLLFVTACSTQKGVVVDKPKLLDENTFVITEISTDPSYGFTEKNPIKVGGADVKQGPINERRFLNALAGPNGEPISYRRTGSCCPFKTPNGLMGGGLLDHYRVTWEGAKDTLSIFINMYDHGNLQAPKGFRIKNKTMM